MGPREILVLGKKDAFSNKIELGIKTMVLTTCFMLMPVEIYQDSWTIKKVEMGVLNRARKGWGRQNLSVFSSFSFLFFDFFFSLLLHGSVYAFSSLLKAFTSLGLSSASPLSSNCRFLSPLPLLSYSLWIYPPSTSDDLFPLCCKLWRLAMRGTLRPCSLVFSSYRWAWKAQEKLTCLLKSPR